MSLMSGTTALNGWYEGNPPDRWRLFGSITDRVIVFRRRGDKTDRLMRFEFRSLRRHCRLTMIRADPTTLTTDRRPVGTDRSGHYDAVVPTAAEQRRSQLR